MLLRLTEEASKCTSLRVITVNLQPVLTDEREVVAERRQDLQTKMGEILNKHDRSDITAVVVAMGVEPVENDYAV